MPQTARPRVAADPSGPSSVQSLSRGLEILSQFTAESKQPDALTELSRRTGLHRATVYRFVKTLENEGYLVSTGSGSYSVGPAWAMALYALGQRHGVRRDPEHRSPSAGGIEPGQRWLSESSALSTTCSIFHILPPARSFVPSLPPNRLHPLHATWNVHSQILLAYAGEDTKRRIAGRPADPGQYSLSIAKAGYVSRMIEPVDASKDVNVGDIELRQETP